MKIDLAKTPLQNLLDLYNNANGLDLTLDEVSFSVPTTAIKPRNTLVIMGNGLQGTFVDSVTLNYDRVKLSSLGTEVSVTLTPNLTLPEIKALVVAQLELYPDEVDFVELVVPPYVAVTPAPKLTLKAIINSYVYTGEVSVELKTA